MSAMPDESSSAYEQTVSDTVARLFLELFGRGPLGVRTYDHGDVLTTVMRNVFTPAELALIAADRSESVMTTRMMWQEVTETEFKNAVGAATGRTVLSVVSGYAIKDEIATEVFLLDPIPV